MNVFVNRVLDYARRTGIKIKTVPRLQSWSRFGLPDMRGFTPHLRTVNVSRDQSSRIQGNKLPSALLDADLWLIHDLLHIIFYDFATLNLGRREWKSADRFIEVHLASEAFAVLALDYHHLVFTAKQGLAVSLNHVDWPRFQELAPQLPDIKSYFFTQTLLEYYLAGGGLLSRLTPPASRGKFAKKLNEWIGHEQRYATKQRFYVKSWVDDLQARKVAPHAASIEDSRVAEPLWGLLQLIHYSPDHEWADYVSEVTAMVKGHPRENYFNFFAKYRRQKFPLDFRFTDFHALTKTEIIREVKLSLAPSASALFLFWQIISESSPTLMNTREKSAVRDLAIESQGLVITAGRWLPVQSLALKILKARQWRPDSEVRSTFFLP